MFSIKLSQRDDKNIKLNKREFNDSLQLKAIPETFFIKRIGNIVFLYSPLNLKIYGIKKDEYERYLENKLTPQERESFFYEDLLIERQINPIKDKVKNGIAPVIFLTNKCNLKCVYCFSKGGDSYSDNSFKAIKKTIDFWKDYEQDSKKDKIVIFSRGEPTCAFRMMKDTFDYVNKSFENKIDFSIITNGTFNRKIADWLIKNNIKVQISCDGPSNIQDSQRPCRDGSKSSHIVEKNIKYFVKRGYKNFFTHSVITSDSLDKIEEIVNYFSILGVDKIEIKNVTIMGRAAKELSVLNKKYVQNVMKAIELSEAYGTRLYTNIIPMKVSRKFCGAGTIAALYENGTIGTCHNVEENNKHDKLFIIGKYDKKTDKIKLNEKKRTNILNRIVDRIEDCKKCAIKYNCRGGCPQVAVRESGKLFSKTNDCTIVKDGYKKFLDYKIQKNYVKVKPCLEIKNEKIYYSMICNKFELSHVKNEDVKGNSFIEISEKTNLKKLARNIIKARDLNGYKTSIFVLSFGVYEKNINEIHGEKIINFLKKLKKNKIFFIISKPTCRKIFGKKYNFIAEEFNIPKNWFEAAELFMLRDEEVLLKNGSNTHIKNDTTRNSIYEKFKKSDKDVRLPFGKCKHCIYSIRKNCGYVFF